MAVCFRTKVWVWLGVGVAVVSWAWSPALAGGASFSIPPTAAVTHEAASIDTIILLPNVGTPSFPPAFSVRFTLPSD